MNLEQYTKINNFFIRHSTAFSLLLTANRLLTACGFLLYPLLLLCLLTKKNIAMLISFIAIPALCFLAVTIFRKVVNKKRPYEKLPIQSLIKKDKKGQSFPSRHVFSILAIVRVIGGIHFVTDVCAGALLGVLAGLISNYVFLIS